MKNIQKRKKIEVIINSPNLVNMPLSMAVQEKTDEEKLAEEEEKLSQLKKAQGLFILL